MTKPTAILFSVASIIFLAPSSPKLPQSSIQSIPSFCNFFAVLIASSISDTPIICETPLCIDDLSFLLSKIILI